MKPSQVLKYWEERAQKEYGSALQMTSNDPLLAELETAALNSQLANLPPNAKLLEIGCGSGRVIAELLKTRPYSYHGVDFSETMIRKAQSLSLAGCTFEVSDMKAFRPSIQYDAVFLVRSITNLTTFEDQVITLDVIANATKDDGVALLLEPTMDGLDSVNSLRACLGIEPIQPHEYNVYLRLQEFLPEFKKRFPVTSVVEFASTYYFVSRVLNAALALHDKRVPSYSDPLNLASLRLPQIGSLGAHKLLIGRKR